MASDEGQVLDVMIMQSRSFVFIIYFIYLFQNMHIILTMYHSN